MMKKILIGLISLLFVLAVSIQEGFAGEENKVKNRNMVIGLEAHFDWINHDILPADNNMLVKMVHARSYIFGVYETLKHNKDSAACWGIQIPHTATASMAPHVVYRYLVEHKEHWDRFSWMLVMQAFRNKWPVKEDEQDTIYNYLQRGK